MAEQVIPTTNSEFVLSNGLHECCAAGLHSTIADCVDNSAGCLTPADLLTPTNHCPDSLGAYEAGTITGEFVSFPVQQRLLCGGNGLPLKKRASSKAPSRPNMRAGSRRICNSHRMANCRCGDSAAGAARPPSGRVSTAAGSGIPFHPCTECQKVFGSPGKLHQHMFVHTGERPFRCGECEKGFSSRFKLMRHALIHSSDRRYKCSFCERCFHRKDHLKNHLQVHNPNKKTYRCGECDKEYNSRLSFRKHVAVHAAAAGDLECKVCGKRFACTDEIVYHLKVHTGSRTIKSPSEKKFKCDFCERRFFTRKDVKRHLVVHTGRRDFLCQFCPQRFGRKDHLVRHIKKSHLLSKAAAGKDAAGGGGEGSLAVASSGQNSLGGGAATATGFPHFDCCLPLQPSSSSSPPPSFVSLSPSEFLHVPAAHHVRHHGGCMQDFKQVFHASSASSLPVAAAAASASFSLAASCSGPFPPDVSHDFKLYDEIKVERDDDQLIAASPLDISQLLGFLPISSAAHSLAGSPTPPATTAAGTFMAPGHVMTSLGQIPVNATPLPQFNQAFQ